MIVILKGGISKREKKISRKLKMSILDNQIKRLGLSASNSKVPSSKFKEIFKIYWMVQFQSILSYTAEKKDWVENYSVLVAKRLNSQYLYLLFSINQQHFYLIFILLLCYQYFTRFIRLGLARDKGIESLQQTLIF